MVRTITAFVCALTILFSSCRKTQKFYNEHVSIIPQPNNILLGEEYFLLNSNTKLMLPKTLINTYSIQNLQTKVQKSTGFNLTISDKEHHSNYIAIDLTDSDSIEYEGYNLAVTPFHITIEAATGKGVQYAIETLLQLLPAEIVSPEEVTSVEWKIPCLTIHDSPRFKWRGLHLDLCRHFLPIDQIKRHIDMISQYKLNTLHLHLTEDQAWRIEIKKYPLLVEKGSKRIEGEGHEYSGYYTQDQLLDLVEYAAQRHIEIVPEIEMPGHALAALAGYPELSCSGGPFSPRIIWGVEEDVFCAGNDNTFTFIEDIIKEVVQIFPSQYIHIGGDECPKKRWKECKQCQKRIKENNLKNEDELQSYFIKRIEKILLSHNRRMIGWDEILEGGLAPTATVMSWRGEKGGVEAANMGHNVIMTPSSHCYLDHYQGSPKVEPVAIGGYTTLEKTYSYNPVPENIHADKKHHILGTQGNVWSEYLYTPDSYDYAIYPRIIALAEVGWTQLQHKEFASFVRRLDKHHVRMDLQEVNYHIPLPQGPANTEAFIDSAVVSFTTTRETDIIYTTDKSKPDAKSKRYTSPLVFKENTTLSVATILKTGKISPARTIELVKQEYLKPTNPEGLEQGLNVSVVQGVFRNVADLDTVSRWQDTIIEAKHFYRLLSYRKPSAAIATGYIKVPENGIYRFSTNVDNFYIGDNLLIDNKDAVKRFSRNDATIALEAGLHRVKFIVLNVIIGGWPQSWNGVLLEVSSDRETFNAADFY